MEYSKAIELEINLKISEWDVIFKVQSLFPIKPKISYKNDPSAYCM